MQELNSEATSISSLTDREFDLWKYELDKYTAGLISAGQAVRRTSIYIGLFMVTFAIVTYSDFLGDSIKISLIGWELTRWNTAILGPPILSCFLYYFGTARAQHKWRMHCIEKHLSILRKQPDEVHANYPQENLFISLVMEPSIFNFVDRLKKPRIIQITNHFALFIWIWIPAFAQLHMSYIILIKFSWHVWLLVAYLLLGALSLFSLFGVATIDTRKVEWEGVENL